MAKERYQLALYGGPKATDFSQKQKGKKVFYNRVDRLPRFEIDDSKSFLSDLRSLATDKAGVKLKDIFAHDELYKNYPELKDFKIVIQDAPIDDDSDVGGVYDRKKKTIFMRKPTSAELDKDPNIMKKLLIHELQHAIQDKEGFAYTTPGTLFDYGTRPGEAEAYESQDRTDLTSEQRDKYGQQPYLYTQNRKETSPQKFYPLGDEMDVAAEEELNRRYKEKEEMPIGYENFKPKPVISPTKPKVTAQSLRALNGMPSLGVIYPNIPQEQQNEHQPYKPSPKEWWTQKKQSYSQNESMDGMESVG